MAMDALPATPDLTAAFADAHPVLPPAQALVEADRCYFCYDAPCIEACPTGIDVPGFIKGIATGNVRGAALGILDANIFGGTCARVCPTEVLCEQACVRNTEQDRPIRIGALQRYATDWLMEREPTPFARGMPSAGQVAVVGAGPSGLACAHRLARLGHEVTVFEARPKPGGLNEYGIAAYKMADDFAQREAAFILGIGGITIRYGQALGDQIDLADLRAEYQAVFLACGQAGVRALALDHETMPGVRDAVAFIAELRQATDKSSVSVGRRVLVIGGGNTAVDAAVQSKLLGAEDVTIAYRRGPETMSATAKEQAWARQHGIQIMHWSRPMALLAGPGGVAGVQFEHVQRQENFVVAADLVLKAVGQRVISKDLNLTEGRIVVDPSGRTALPFVYAGGDCVAGPDLTVQAVQDGKTAALAIHHDLGRDIEGGTWPI